MHVENNLGNVVVNFTSSNVKYTTIIEHKHFENVKNNPKTIITYEYPLHYQKNMERYYTVNDEKNNFLAK